jgi:4-diphosphocytidyl-2-C-methyl-D-erythritol kinase
MSFCKFNKFENYRPREDKCNIILISDQNNDIGSFCSGLFNIFETVVEPERVCVTELKSTMTENGAIAAMMSGSGTSVFGIFQNVDDALKVEKLLRGNGAEAYVCYPI